jgi:hypothetical protein
MIRIHVSTTHRDVDNLERCAGSAYLVDESKARELAAMGVLMPTLEPADLDNVELCARVAALHAELFPEPDPVTEEA